MAIRRARRERFRQRRRDLAQDVVVALLLTSLLFALTAGLGVVALIDVPIAMVLVASIVIDRRRRSRRRHGSVVDEPRRV